MADRLVAWLYDTPVAVLMPRAGVPDPAGVARRGDRAVGARQPRPVRRAADRRPDRSAGHARPGLLREHAARGTRSRADGGPGRGPPGGHLRHPGGLRPRLRGGDHGAPRRGPARRERRQRVLPDDARRPAAGDQRPRRRPPGRRAGARLPPVAGRLPAQGAAGPGRRRHLAASRPGTLPRPGYSSPTARTRWLPTRPPACGSPPPAGWRCPRPNCSTSPGFPCWRSSATTGRTHLPGTSRSGCTRRTAARRPPRLPG